MKIAIDAFRTVCEPQTSGAIYVAELAAALAELPQVTVVWLVVPNRPWPPGAQPTFASDKVKWLVAASGDDPSGGFIKQLMWVQRTYPATVRAQAGEVDWLIAPYHQTPLRVPRGWRVLTVIHDLCGLRADCGYKKLGKGYWRHFLNFVTASLGADAVVAISDYTRREMQRLFPSMLSRPTVVAYNAVTAPALDAGQVQASLAGLALPHSYFLAYAAAGPRKGTDLTLQAYAAYRQAGGAAGLVLIGGRSGTEQWKAVADALGAPAITWLGGISDTVRDALYARAVALVFPSRCEGFGYPIVEAMRQGCPVVADIASPAAEIVGDSQVLLQTLSMDTVLGGMLAFEAMGALERTALAAQVRAASARFSGAGLAASYLKLMGTPA